MYSLTPPLPKKHATPYYVLLFPPLIDSVHVSEYLMIEMAIARNFTFVFKLLLYLKQKSLL